MSLSRLDLNLLLVLDAVLAERNVARAAHRLHVTPSAISNSLARLRVMLGDPLVVRGGRGVVPTPRAATLAGPLKRALGQLELSIAGDVFDPATTTTRFTLAIADAGQLARVPRLVGLLARSMPHARLRVVSIDTYLSSGGLTGTEVDAAIVAVIDDAPGIRAIKIGVEETVLVAARGHRQVRDRINKRQLASLEHVDVEVAPGRGYRELHRTYERLGIERHVRLTVPSFMAAATVVAQSDLVATVPASLVSAHGERLGLRVVAGAPVLKSDLKLAWHDRTHDDPAMRAFRALLATPAP